VSTRHVELRVVISFLIIALSETDPVFGTVRSVPYWLITGLEHISLSGPERGPELAVLEAGRTGPQ
jgi:hypothetical protein